MACATAVSGFNFSYMFIYKYCIVQRSIYATSATSIKVQVLTTYRMSVLCGVLYCLRYTSKAKRERKTRSIFFAWVFQIFFLLSPLSSRKPLFVKKQRLICTTTKLVNHNQYYLTTNEGPTESLTQNVLIELFDNKMFSPVMKIHQIFPLIYNFFCM